MEHFDRARDKILMGTERRSMAMSEQEKTLTAYHEAGHAIVGRLVPEHDPVYKVTIIPRGRALGVTMYLPEGDKYSYNRTAIESMLCSLYGGRVAEELIFGNDKVTTGASNDIERATKMARNMVDQVGPVRRTRARSPTARKKTKCSWAVRSRSTRTSPTTPRARSTKSCTASSTRPTTAPSRS